MARRMTKLIGFVASAALAALTVGMAFVVFLLPRLTHGEALTVLTGSMRPTIPPGSLVFVRPVDPHNVRQGEVITFAVKSQHYGTALVTHRVAAVKYALDSSGAYQPEFVTKGDANNAPDADPVLAPNVRGVMWFHVPYVGGIRDALHTKGGAASIAMLVVAGYGVLQLVGAYKDRKYKNGKNASAATTVAPTDPVPTWVIEQLASSEFVSVAQFSAARAGGTSARVLAWLMGGTLITETPDAFTVLVVADATHSKAAADKLNAFGPSLVWSNRALVPDEATVATAGPELAKAYV